MAKEVIRRAFSSNEITGLLKKNGFSISVSSTTSVRNYHQVSSGVTTSIISKAAKINESHIAEVYQVRFVGDYNNPEMTKKAELILRDNGYNILKKRAPFEILVEGRFVRSL